MVVSTVSALCFTYYLPFIEEPPVSNLELSETYGKIAGITSESLEAEPFLEQMFNEMHPKLFRSQTL